MKFKRLYNTEEHRREVKDALKNGSMLLILRAFFFPPREVHLLSLFSRRVRKAG